jgi:hypothetical protein
VFGSLRWRSLQRSARMLHPHMFMEEREDTYVIDIRAYPDGRYHDGA